MTHICVRKLTAIDSDNGLVTWAAPRHYLDQCWNIVNWSPGNKCQTNCNQNSCIFIQEMALENVVWLKAANLSRPQCVELKPKISWQGTGNKIKQIKLSDQMPPPCIPIAVPILLFHLSETPRCRSLCACVHRCIYTYMYFKIFYGSTVCWLFISFQPEQYTWHVRVRHLICRSNERLVMVWSRGLPGLECRNWV